MHYWFGATMKTLCNMPLVKDPKGGVMTRANGIKATGIDSLVRCGDCKAELRSFRKLMPQGQRR